MLRGMPGDEALSPELYPLIQARLERIDEAFDESVPITIGDPITRRRRADERAARVLCRARETHPSPTRPSKRRPMVPSRLCSRPMVVGAGMTVTLRPLAEQRW